MLCTFSCVWEKPWKLTKFSKSRAAVKTARPMRRMTTAFQMRRLRALRWAKSRFSCSSFWAMLSSVCGACCAVPSSWLTGASSISARRIRAPASGTDRPVSLS